MLVGQDGIELVASERGLVDGTTIDETPELIVPEGLSFSIVTGCEGIHSPRGLLVSARSARLRGVSIGAQRNVYG